MIKWDLHMHSHHSGDSKAKLQDMILSAKQKGLDGICITDHYDYDFPDEPDLFLLDFSAYIKEITSLKEFLTEESHSADKDFEVRLGLELGLQTHLVEHHREILSLHNFDFVIGSTHVVNKMDPYFPKFFEGREEKAAYREYFKTVLENVKYDMDFNVYGHLDYVVRYGPTKNANYRYADYAEIIEEILRTLISSGKGIEVNTGGFQYGLGHPNPTLEILKRYKELGGEILTVGSDAHKPEVIAYDFNKIPPILKEAGFEYYTIFKNRKPEFLKIF